MHNELRFAGWKVDRVGPLGTDWIETFLVAQRPRIARRNTHTWKADLPADHAVRVEHMKLSLDGLGLGDALAKC